MHIYVSGTRIIYERNFLMQCRNSPLAKSPPANLPKIPGVTSPDTGAAGDSKENGHPESIPGIKILYLPHTSLHKLILPGFVTQQSVV